MSRLLPGFNLLQRRKALPPAALRRLLLLSALLGAAVVGVLLRQAQAAVDQLQARASVLHEQRQSLEARWQALQAQAAQKMQHQQESQQHLALHQRQAQLLAVLHALGAVPGPRLTQLRWDAQGLWVSGQGPGAQVQAWTDERSHAVPGLGTAELVELGALTAGAAGPQVRFVLRWPLAADVAKR